MTDPTTYYSTGQGEWSLIHQGMPCCKNGTFEEAERCAKFYKLKPALDYWDGDAGAFKPLYPTDTLQAAEAAAYTLTHTKNQPRSTGAQTPLF